MKAVTQVLNELAEKAFEECGYSATLGVVTVSDRLDLCQFQCNGAFAGAKLYKKAPFMIAEDVAKVLSENEMFKKVEVCRPGFINMTLKDEYLVALANGIFADENSGIEKSEKPETIVIDYGGPNVAKPLHIGHLRSAIIGESLKRLARACGHKVVGDVHLGDWGLQIGLVIAELSERHPEWRCFAEDFSPENDAVEHLDADTLNEVYPFASSKSKQNEQFKLKAQRITAELQNRRAGYIALWQEILRVSIADLKSNYEKLNVDFDLWYGESDSDKYVDELIDILNNKNLLRESDGAMVVDVEKPDDKAPMPPVIVKKSDNSNIYATTDLATIIQRQKDFEPDRIWYVVDKRQSLHFEQVFRCAKKAELVPESTELSLLGFGTMNGSDGKPYKTRDGGVMRLSDLIETVTQAALEKINASSFVDGDETVELARKIGIAAIKFGDLINHRTKDYIFDMDKFLSFEGKTGTYLLYTISRINSILAKAQVNEDVSLSLENIYGEAERELILKLILTSETFKKAFEDKAPNYICENAYQIASAFSSFYAASRIIDEQDDKKRTTWLALVKLTRKMLLSHLDVLGIEAVENM